MVTIIIYLKIEHNTQALVEHLLTSKLIAAATIDLNNVWYKMQPDQLVTESKNVISAQSKALLFNDVVTAVEKYIGNEVAINSTPIVASNRIFDSYIKSQTISI